MDLAKPIVQTKVGHFRPGKFEDRYEKALRELIAKKQAGEQIEAPKARAPAKIINLMDALARPQPADRRNSFDARPDHTFGSKTLWQPFDGHVRIT